MNLTPEIIYEDSDILVINKPAGLLTHQKNQSDTSDTLVSWLLSLYPEIKKIKDPFEDQGLIQRPGIVHRLDRETSGVMVIAKTQDAFNFLKNKFQKREMQKTYWALAYGHILQKEGIIDAPIGTIGVQQTTRVHGAHELESKEALTEYKVLHRFQEGYTLVEVRPKTGRTHQIRIHLKHIGHPLVCDRFYAPTKACPIELGRLFLHAKTLQFTTPSGKALTVDTDLPQDLAYFLTSLTDIAKNEEFL
jgi:23S rRNA pseudouridine1911/1915/1917 synthase